MIDFLFKLSQALLIQILGLFGIFFIFGIILAKLQQWTNGNYQRAIGWKGILLTAWLGTPIHEIGHAVFAKIFHHKINHFSLFKPNEATGGLGHVEHSFNRHNLYQRLGNFFIGAAPMIFGSLVLVALLYFLVPNGKEVFLPLTSEPSSIAIFFNSLKNTLLNFFAPTNLSNWQFWIFVYLAFCISAHIAPSQQDREGMWDGFIWIVFLIIIANILTLALEINITRYLLGLFQYLGIFIAIFTFTILISLLHFICSSLIFWPFRK